jgi:hypothetical protein
MEMFSREVLESTLDEVVAHAYSAETVREECETARRQAETERDHHADVARSLAVLLKRLHGVETTAAKFFWEVPY